MKNDTDPDVAKLIEEITGGDGGVNAKTAPLSNGGVSLKLNARSVIKDFLQARVKEINNAEGAERRRLIDATPEIFRDTLKINATPGEASAEGAILQIMHPVGGERFAAHAFDTEDGLAFIEHGWADAYPGSGQPCHMLYGEIEPRSHQTWGANDPELGEIMIRLYRGPEKPDGPRAKAKEILEQSLSITIPDQPSPSDTLATR